MANKATKKTPAQKQPAKKSIKNPATNIKVGQEYLYIGHVVRVIGLSHKRQGSFAVEDSEGDVSIVGPEDLEEYYDEKTYKEAYDKAKDWALDAQREFYYEVQLFAQEQSKSFAKGWLEGANSVFVNTCNDIKRVLACDTED